MIVILDGKKLTRKEENELFLRAERDDRRFGLFCTVVFAVFIIGAAARFACC